MQAELVKCIGFKWADSECFEIVSCQLPVKLYAGDHMTSANMYRIWEDITADQLLGPSLKSRARFHVDMSCTDRGANCGKTNRICRHMNPSRLRLCDLGCALHNGHLACKACLRPLRKLWSGSLAFTLSQAGTGAEEEIRDALRTTLRRRAWVRMATQPPGPEHPTMVYRKVVLDKLLDPLLDAERLVSLEFHFKGDLTDSRIPLFIAEAPGVEEEAIIDSWFLGAA